jgi:mRNA-degrading endonuclease RelE of RelBE toxin-antitoxin system
MPIPLDDQDAQELFKSLLELAKVIVSPQARDDLDEPIRELKLPPDTRQRVKKRLRSLERFPARQKLSGQWEGFRFVLGPWGWMLIVFTFDEETDEVIVATIQDARSSTFVTADRR